MYLVPPWSNLCHSAQSVFPLSCLRLLRGILLRTAEAINRTSFQREGVFLSGTSLPEEKTKLEWRRGGGGGGVCCFLRDVPKHQSCSFI